MRRVGRLEDKLWREVLAPVAEGDVDDLLPRQEAEVGRLERELWRELGGGVEVDLGWLDSEVRRRVDEELWALARGCRDPWACYRALMRARLSGDAAKFDELRRAIMAGRL